MSADPRQEPLAPLDGNAAAGALRQVFAFEATTAEATCAACGALAPIGEVKLHGGAMGIVLRCAGCDAALIRLVRTPYGAWFEMQGVRSLFVRSGSE